MPIQIWTKKFMLRPVTHCRSGCRGAGKTDDRGQKTEDRRQKEKTVNQWRRESGIQRSTAAILKVMSTTLGPRP